MTMAFPPDQSPLTQFPPEQPAPVQQAPLPSPVPDPSKSLLVTLPMDEKELAEWRERVKLSEERTKQRETEWDTLWKEYLPHVGMMGHAATPKVSAHFRNTHTKMGQLFVKSPAVILEPKGRGLEVEPQPPMIDPMTGMAKPQPPLRAADGIAARQAVTNMYMGADYIDSISLMDECLLNMLSYSGWAAVLVSYQSVSKTVNRPIMGPDPNWIAPPIAPGSLGLNMPIAPMVPQIDPLTGQPMTEAIQVPMHECWEAECLDPKKVLFDERLKSVRVKKKSRWIGHTFFMSKRIAMRKYQLTPEQIEAATDKDDRTYEDEQDKPAEMVEKDLLRGQEIWLKADQFTDNDNPDAIVHLVLFDCIPDKPIVYRMSVDQTFDDMGQLTEDSLEGFPIIVGSLRPTIGSPFAKSDAAFVDIDVKQINTHRRQMVKLRDAAIGKMGYDVGQIDEEDKNKLENGEPGAMIGLKPGSLAQGTDKIFAAFGQVKSTNDDWRTAEMFERDMEKTLGISSAQLGGQNDKVISATEVQTQSQGSIGRAEKEKARVIAFYLEIYRAVDTLIQRYATGNRYVMVAGQTNAKKLEVWNKKIGAGKYSYNIKPDSQLANDVARDRQQAVQVYVATAADALVNRAPILRDIFSKHGFDPSETVREPDIVNAEMMLQQQGLPIGQPPHQNPGNKHIMEKSGGTPNGPGQADSGDNRQERNPRPGGGA